MYNQTKFPGPKYIRRGWKSSTTNFNTEWKSTKKNNNDTRGSLPKLSCKTLRLIHSSEVYFIYFLQGFRKFK